MEAGTAQICITPPVGVDLSGFGARVQPSTGKLDELYVRGLYLEQDEDRLLWLHADLLGFDRDWVCGLRSEIAAELALEIRQVVVSATHTHSGPATLALRGCGAVNETYLAGLAGRMHEAARIAVRRPQPVTVRFGDGRCAVAIDRRAAHGAAPHVDHRVPVLVFESGTGTALAVLTNYPVHNVGLGPANRDISADIAGAAAREVRDALPGEPVVLVTNGACGDLNPRNACCADPAAMQAQGHELAEAVLEAAATAARVEAPRLASVSETIRLPLSVLTAAEVDSHYRRAVRQWQPANTANRRLRAALAQWRRETKALLQSKPPTHVSTDVQVVRIGPAAIVAMGAEVFSRMAGELRAAHGPHTYVVGYANGDLGYLPPADAYAEGGYEVDAAFMFYGYFMVAPGSYEQFRDSASQLLTRTTPGNPNPAQAR